MRRGRHRADGNRDLLLHAGAWLIGIGTGVLCGGPMPLSMRLPVAATFAGIGAASIAVWLWY